jgi:hypothetical protein
MAKLKMKSYPKRPKASASLATLENYLQKVREIDKENATRKSTNAKRDKLAKQIAGIGKAGTRKVSVSVKRKKKTTTTKKRKATTRKKRR